ncbi:MAG: Kelch repeat-containing protein [Polyangiales bacterium]
MADTVPADAACVLPKTETRACGACGTQSRHCLIDGTFSPWTDCTGEQPDAECKIGEKRTSDCGNCGTETDTCNPTTCMWNGGACTGEGVCAAGDTQATTASCSEPDAVRTRTCDDKCKWSDYSACELPRGWLPLASISLSGRAFHSAVWTGSKMVIWGGGKSVGTFNDGAVYDLATNTWTKTSSSGLSTRRQHMTVWTGSKMMVWGGWDNTSRFNNGAIYDPATDSWVPTSTSSLGARHSGAAVWSTTTNTMIVWGGCTSGWCTAVASDGASYDPATGVWTALPPAPIAGRSDPLYTWTGSELVIWGGRNALGVALSDGARFDPQKNVWTKFSDPAPGVLDARYDASFGNDGSGNLFIWGGRAAVSSTTPNAKANGAIYKPGAGFVPILGAPTTLLGPSSQRYDSPGFIAGNKLFLLDGITGSKGDAPQSGFAAYDFTTSTWSDLDRTGATITAHARASVVWTGREAIYWGGVNGNECCTGYNDGAIYRP